MRAHHGPSWKQVVGRGCVCVCVCVCVTTSDTSHLIQAVEWKKVYDSQSPQSAQLVSPWDKLNDMQKLIVLRLLRPDKASSLSAFTLYVWPVG